MTTYHKPEELMKMIRKAPSGTTFLLRVRNAAPTSLKQGVYPCDWRDSAVSGYVKVTRPAALQFAQQLKDESKAYVCVEVETARKYFWFGA